METILLYLLKAHLVASLLFAVYFLLLKNEFFLKLNRLILLVIIFLAIALPVLPMVQLDFTTNILKKTSTVNPLPGIIGHVGNSEIQRSVIEPTINITNTAETLSAGNLYIRVFIGLYAIVICILLMRFLSNIYQVFRFVHRNKPVSHDGLRYISPEESVAPFSFFHYIVINRDQYNKDQFRQIITHEKAHTDQWHSIDILLAELLHIFLWCNPLVKFFKESVKLNLEYLADREVLNKGFDKTSYQRSILHQLMNLQGYSLVNSFHSKTKLRIMRMNEEEENTNLYKYLLIIPLVAAIYILINPLDARALNRLDLQTYAGFYELATTEANGVVAVKIVVKNDHLVMQTPWNGKEIWFEKQSELKFTNREVSLPLEFYKTPGPFLMVAFNKDTWVKVTEKNYRPVSVKDGQQEKWIFAYDQNGGMHTAVYSVNPWDAVKNYKPPG